MLVCGSTVGRLDMDSDGLLLMTDDGELTNRLTHPRHEIPKHYHVTVKGDVDKDTLARLCAPFLLDGSSDLLPCILRYLESRFLCIQLFQREKRKNGSSPADARRQT